MLSTSIHLLPIHRRRTMPSHSPIYDLSAKVLRPIGPYIPPTLRRWEQGVTPLSDFRTVLASMALYLVTIFSLRFLIQNLKERKSAARAQGPKANGKANGHAAGDKPRREPPLIPSSYLKYPFLVHNLALSVGSGWLLALMLEEILPIMQRNGPFYSICSQGAWTMRMETFYIINYSTLR